MLGPERRIVGVFDWELAHLGPGRGHRVRRAAALPRLKPASVASSLAPDEFFARYEELTGLRVEADTFRFGPCSGS